MSSLHLANAFGFGLRLLAKLNTVQRSSLMAIRTWGFAKGGVAMLMLGFSAGFCVEPPEPKGHRRVRPSWFSLYK